MYFMAVSPTLLRIGYKWLPEKLLYALLDVSITYPSYMDSDSMVEMGWRSDLLSYNKKGGEKA